MTVDIERRLLRWGNGFGLRITKEEASRLGVEAGSPIHANVAPAMVHNDLDSIVLFHSRRPYDVKRIVEDDT